MVDKKELEKYKDNPNVKKMLDLLAYTEGTDALHGYQTLVGGKKIDDLSTHPNKVGLETRDGKSTAFGRYQITGTTWRGLQKKYGFNDFSPQTQDLAAIALLKDAGALIPVINGDFKAGIDKSKNVWVSLPNSATKNQPEKSWGDVSKFLNGTSLSSKFESPRDIYNNVQAQFKQEAQPSKLDNIYKAFLGNKMNTQEKAEFIQDVQEGRVVYPENMRNKILASVEKNKANVVDIISPQIVDAYNNGSMDEQAKKELDADLANNLVALPKNVVLNKEPAPTFWQKLRDPFTGELRKTQISESSPNWLEMPEMQSGGWQGIKSRLGTAISSTPEAVRILQENNPNIKVSQDAKGNFLIRSAIDNKLYATKAGIEAADIENTIALGAIGALATPARVAQLAGGSILGALGVGAGTQAVVEGTQASIGGTVDPAEILVAGALGAAAKPLGDLVTGAIDYAAPAVKRVLQKAQVAPQVQAPNQVQVQAPPLAQVQVNTPQQVQAPPQGTFKDFSMAADARRVAAPASTTSQIPPSTAPAPEFLGAEDLVKTARKASESSINSKAAKALAEQAAPDDEVVAAAKRLGIDEYLQPDHVTTNQAFRELSQAIKSVPSSTARVQEIEGLAEVAKRADDIIEKIGTTDLSELDSSLQDSMSKTQKQLDNKADKLYAKLRSSINETAFISTDNTSEYLIKKAEKLQGVGNLSAMEEKVFMKLVQNPSPNYALLDDVRRDLTAARVRREGTFKDEELGRIKKLEWVLSKDQRIAAKAAGKEELFLNAKRAVAIRKGLEDDMMALFGKELDKSMLPQLKSAVVALPAGNVKRFTKLLGAIPVEQRQEVVASGLNTAFGKNAKNGNLNFTSYVNWFEGLERNKAAKAAIMSNIPKESVQQLHDLYKVSKGISLASKERITTGRIMAVQENFRNADTLMSDIYQAAKRASLGLGAEIITTPLGLMGTGLAAGITSALMKGRTKAIEAADKLIASSDFIRLAKLINSDKQKVSNLKKEKLNENGTIKKFLNSIKFINYLKEIGEKYKTEDDRLIFLINLLSATNSKSESEKEKKDANKR